MGEALAAAASHSRKSSENSTRLGIRTCCGWSATQPRSGASRESRLRVNLRALLYELLRLFFHALLQRLFLGEALFGGVFADVFGDLYRAEVRAAHGAEVRGLCAFLRQRLVVELARGDGVEAELIFLAEWARLRPQPRPVGLSLREILLAASQAARIKARLTQCVVALLRAGMTFRQVGGVRGDFVGDDAVFHVFLVRQRQARRPRYLETDGVTCCRSRSSPCRRDCPRFLR